MKKQAVIVVSLTLWISLVGFGISILFRYSNTPGEAANPPMDWPANAPLKPGKRRATLLMFAHPNCPCSRASVGELALIMARSQEKLDAHVFLYMPITEVGSWARTDLWHSASSIPGVRVIEDRDGAFAARLGAFTSGQTFLYNPGGQLLFNGGITVARGHSGDNHGRRAIVALLQGEAVEPNVTPVFGCSLRGN